MIYFDEQFFEKHQKNLLFVANKWYLRWILGLNRLPKNIKEKQIDKITTNSIHCIQEDETIKGYFFTRRRFAEALAYNFSPFVYLENIRQTKMIWRFSPAGIIGMLLLLFFPHKLGGFTFFGTVSSPYSGYGECGIFNSSTVWTTVHNATSGSVLGGNGNIDGCLCIKVSSNSSYYLTRYFLKFDTSFVGSAAISSAILYAMNSIANTDPSSDEVCLVSSTAQDTLALSDFDLLGSTLQSDDRFSYNTMDASEAYRSFSLNTAGISNIAKNGTSKFALREYQHDCLNTAPTAGYPGVGAGITYFFNSTYTGTDHDPYLSVTYTYTRPSIFNKGRIGAYFQ